MRAEKYPYRERCRERFSGCLTGCLFGAILLLVLFPLRAETLSAETQGAEILAADPQRTMLILDSSASMTEAVAEGPKVVIARQSVADLMKDWDPGREIGLMAYGHRQKEDCADIETLLPVGPADPAAVVGAVNRMTPRGTTPLAAAVSLAAEEARDLTETEATIQMEVAHVGNGLVTEGVPQLTASTYPGLALWLDANATTTLDRAAGADGGQPDNN